MLAHALLEHAFAAGPFAGQETGMLQQVPGMGAAHAGWEAALRLQAKAPGQGTPASHGVDIAAGQAPAAIVLAPW